MFGRSFTDLPTINSFEEAKRHYEAIKPIRGSDNLRPACNTTNGRRKKHIQIVERNAGNSYAIHLFDTDVVTFHNNKTIEVNNGGWATASTHHLISDMLWRVGIAAQTKDGKSWIVTKSGYWLLPNRKCLILDISQEDTVTVKNPTTIMQHKLKRKEWNAINKKHKEFRATITSMTKLVDADCVLGAGDYWAMQREYDRLTIELLHDKKKAKAALLQGLSVETQAAFIQMYALGAMHSIYERNVDPRLSGFVLSVNPKKVKKLLDDTLKKLYATEVFVEEAAPLGKYVKDTNARFMQ